jgi:hypothetical protein
MLTFHPASFNARMASIAGIPWSERGRSRRQSGVVPRLNQPRGNITGFGLYEATLGGEWLEAAGLAAATARAEALSSTASPEAWTLEQGLRGSSRIDRSFGLR